MSKLQQTLRLTALSAALAGAYGSVQAQDAAAVSDLTKPSSSVSVGAGYWSDDRPHQGIYDGMRDKGSYGLFDAYIGKRDDETGTWFTLDARNLGLDTRELRADWLRQGKMGVFLEYSRIPRDNPYTFLTGVQGIGTTTQRVPTPSATTLTEVQLGTVRDLTTLGFNMNFGGGYDLRLSFRNEDKSGTRQWGRGGALEFAVEPIDSNTRQLDAVLSYIGKSFQLQGGYIGSWYTNANKIVDTANVNGVGVLSNQYFLSLPLDNQAHQLFANGGYNFTPSTRGTFKVSYTQATQDERIPTTDIAAVPKFAGAPTNLDGRIDTTLVQLGLTSRATKEFSWLANLRYYESAEKTPQVRIVEPAGGCGTCVDNTPLTFKTLSGKLEGTYRLQQGLSLIGGLELSDQDRVVPFGNLNASGVDNQRYVPWRTDVKETTYRLQLRRSLSDTVNGSVAYLHSKRDGSDYTQTNEAESNEINPIFIADRDRDRVRLMVDWAPAEALTLTFNAEGAKDKYGNSAARPYGLRDGTAANYSIDAAYSFTDQWQLTAWYGHDNTKANQFGQRAATGGAAAAEKEAQLEDTGDTLGAGLRGVLMPKLRVGVDVLYVKNVNKYPETLTLTGAGAQFPTSAPATAVGPLPDIKNELTRFKLYAVYALQKSSDIRVDYVHELWKTDDWSWMFADGSTFTYGSLTTDGTQVTQSPKQSSDYLGVRYTYRFQ
jgi:MtrB/PioB family decaheme-associated outer membrane protein